MSIRPLPRSARPAVRLQRSLAAVLATLAGGAACADEPSPWYIGASASLTHDSNVNRLGDGVADPDGRADTYYSLGLLGGFDQTYRRQRFYGNATIAYNRYQHHDRLDNTSYGLSTGWDFQTVHNISGGLNASANQSLAQLNGNSLTPTTERNLVRTDQVGGNLLWGGTGILGVQGIYSHARVRYSADSTLNPDSSTDTASLGLVHHVGPSLTTGLAYRYTRTDTPQYGDLSRSIGRNIDLTADYRATAQTGLNARLSYTVQSNAGGSSQEYSGLTGSLNASYAPTGKIVLTAAYNRDAGTNGATYLVPTTTTVGTTTTTTLSSGSYQNTTISDSYTLGLNYAATAKIAANLNYTYRDARIGNGGTAASSDYRDKYQTAGLGLSWAVSRNGSLGCTFSHEKRNTESTPVYAYTANVVGCSGQLTLR